MQYKVNKCNTTQKGHAIQALFCCRHCKQQKRTWSSSRVLAGHYVVNQKYVEVYYVVVMTNSSIVITHRNKECG